MIKYENPLKKNSLKDINLPLFVYLRGQNKKRSQKATKYRAMINTLTSLRFIFALMVFGAHCYTIDKFFDTHFFKEGFVGVSFFFVLSGFIIAYNYQKKFSENKITKRAFWVARIARIYPLHWLTLFIDVYKRQIQSKTHTIDITFHICNISSLQIKNLITLYSLQIK